MPYTNSCVGPWALLSVQYHCADFHSPVGVPSVCLYSLYPPHLQIFAQTASLTFFSHRFGEVKFSARKIDFPMVSLTKANICNQYIERNTDRHPLCGLIVWPGAMSGWILLLGGKPCFIPSSPVFLSLAFLKDEDY